MARPRPAPYIFATWLTGLISSENACEFALWLKTHFQIEKMPRSTDLTKWTVEHGAMVRDVRAELEAQGYTVTTEDENAFRLQGKAALLAGKPDLVAIRGDEARVVDVKTGKRRDRDLIQILLYLFALPHSMRAVEGKHLVGELRYQDGDPVIVEREKLEAVKPHIIDLITRAGGQQPLRKVPSARECGVCEVTQADCPERVTTAVQPVRVDVF